VRRTRLAAAPLILTLLLTGCGGSHKRAVRPPITTPFEPVPVGPGRRYRLPPLSQTARAGAPIGRLVCKQKRPRGFAAHVELYARGLVLPLPAGIGIAPPRTRRGAYVLKGRCSYPIRTHEPTGLVLTDGHRRFTVGQLFAIWGQPLALTRLAGFTGPVIAYVNGRRWYGEPGAIPLARHSEIVLEADGYVPPHPSYLFPPGL
jgi:hypothetical protein